MRPLSVKARAHFTLVLLSLLTSTAVVRVYLAQCMALNGV